MKTGEYFNQIEVKEYDIVIRVLNGYRIHSWGMVLSKEHDYYKNEYSESYERWRQSKCQEDSENKLLRMVILPWSGDFFILWRDTDLTTNDEGVMYGKTVYPPHHTIQPDIFEGFNRANCSVSDMSPTDRQYYKGNSIVGNYYMPGDDYHSMTKEYFNYSPKQRKQRKQPKQK